MRETPGNGLHRRSEFLAAQEHMNNMTAAEQQPLQPVQDGIRLGLSWREKLENHYQSSKKRIPSQRREFIVNALAAVPEPDGKKLRLPDTLPGGEDFPDAWMGKEMDLGEFRLFLAAASGVGESVLRNKIFPDRKRPRLDHVEKLLKFLRKTKAEDFGKFGWYPAAMDLKERKAELEKLLKKKWGCTSLNKAAPYLVLASSTMDNVKTNWNLDGSTAFHIIIALADTPEQLEMLYHWFGMEPILPEKEEAWGEADGVVKISADVFDGLHRALGGRDLEYGSSQFFRMLYTMLIFYDNKHNAALYSQLFRQENEELYIVPMPGEKE